MANHRFVIGRCGVQDLVDGLKRLADCRAILDETPAAQKVVPITGSMM